MGNRKVRGPVTGQRRVGYDRKLPMFVSVLDKLLKPPDRIVPLLRRPIEIVLNFG